MFKDEERSVQMPHGRATRVVPHTITSKETRTGVEVTAHVAGWQVVESVRDLPQQKFADRAVDVVSRHPTLGALSAGSAWMLLGLGVMLILAEPDPEVALFTWFTLVVFTAVPVQLGYSWAYGLQEASAIPVENIYADRGDAVRVADIAYALPESGRARRKAIRAVADEVNQINSANREKVAAEVERQYAHALTATQPTSVPGLSWDGATRIHDTVKQEYGAFLSDPLEVVSLPLLADSKLAEPTNLFERLLIVADDAQRSGDTIRYGNVVLDLSQAWDDAQEYAQLHGTDTLPVEAQVALRRAKKLLAQALDDATPPHVAAAAVRQAEHLLRGVMSVPAVTRGVLENAVRAELPTQRIVETNQVEKTCSGSNTKVCEV